MHDFYYQRLLDDATKFDPRDGNRFLEILDSGDGTLLTFNEAEIAETDIRSYVQQDTAGDNPEKHAMRGLRLLIGSPEEHQNDAKILPLSVSRDTFEYVRSAWHMPRELLRMMLSTLPMAIEFSKYDETGASPIMGLMIRGGRSRDWNYCLGLSHNPATGLTCGFIQGLELREIEKLRTCLQLSQEHFQQPALVPLFLIELKTHFFAILLEDRAARLEETESETGMKHGYSLDPRRNPALNLKRKSRINLDFDPITQKLTSLTGTLAFCDLTFESSLRSLEVTVALSDRVCRNSSPDSSCEATMGGRAAELRGAVELRATYLRTLIAGAQAHRNVLLQRTRAQVQTVYSLIGQRDNRLNIEIGDASRKIAEDSKKTAEDSKKVALLTRRDSANTRIIAAVTLFFLPGTFTATLFSTSFFDFRASNSQLIISWWVWLYFVVTFGLTFVVLLVWWYYSQRSLQKQDPTANKAAEMCEGGADAQLTASLEAESLFESESLWLDQKASTTGIQKT